MYIWTDIKQKGILPNRIYMRSYENKSVRNNNYSSRNNGRKRKKNEEHKIFISLQSCAQVCTRIVTMFRWMKSNNYFHLSISILLLSLFVLSLRINESWATDTCSALNREERKKRLGSSSQQQWRRKKTNNEWNWDEHFF